MDEWRLVSEVDNRARHVDIVINDVVENAAAEVSFDLEAILFFAGGDEFLDDAGVGEGIDSFVEGARDDG